MERGSSLVVLTLLGVVLTAATYEARQPRSEIHSIEEVAENLVRDPDAAVPLIHGVSA